MKSIFNLLRAKVAIIRVSWRGTVEVSEYTVLEIQFRSVKYTVVTRIRKNFEQLLIPVQAIQGDYSL